MRKRMHKTIAIITMHKVLNFGSALQAVALSKYLELNNYTPIIIDYCFPNDYHRSHLRKAHSVEKKETRLYLHINGLCNRFIKKGAVSKEAKFVEFLKTNLNLSAPYETMESLYEHPIKADIYLTGSDQVWNPKWIGEDLSFFLSWAPVHAIKIAYAASFGTKSISEYYKDKYQPYLEQYKYISTREETTSISEMGVKTEQVLDPIFLLDKEQWSTFMDTTPLIKGQYLLCYLLGYSFDPFPYAYQVIRKIQKKTGYKVVMIDGEPINILKGYTIFKNCGPKEFVNLFYNASYIVTSSFHGTAFAINFNKPFISIVNDKDENDNRQASLINILGLDEKLIIKKNASVKKILLNNGNHSHKLEEMRRKSRSFLLNSLKD